MKLLAAAAVLGVSAATAGAGTITCKISVVGGSFKGKTYKLRMQDGQFVGDKGFRDSKLKGCVGKKKIYGRWYHLCQKGKIIVYREEDNVWKRLSAKNLKKYKHNCL